MRAGTHTCRIAAMCGVLATPAVAAGAGDRCRWCPRCHAAPMCRWCRCCLCPADLARLGALPNWPRSCAVDAVACWRPCRRSRPWRCSHPVLPAWPATHDDERARGSKRSSARRKRKQREAERRQRVDDSLPARHRNPRAAPVGACRRQFTSVIDAQNSTRVDAALYWKAYALDKLNQQADALAALAQLIKSYPQSRWLADAKAPRIPGAPERRASAAARSRVGRRTEAARHPGPAALRSRAGRAHAREAPAGNRVAAVEVARACSCSRRATPPVPGRCSPRSPGAAPIPTCSAGAIQYLGVNGTAENRAVLAEIYAGAAT